MAEKKTVKKDTEKKEELKEKILDMWLNPEKTKR